MILRKIYFIGISIIVLMCLGVPSVVYSSEILSFEAIMSSMVDKDITYTGSFNHGDRPMKVFNKNKKWIMENTMFSESSEIKPAGDNKISMNDYPSNWEINGTWGFKKIDGKCKINHGFDGNLEMYWSC